MRVWSSVMVVCDVVVCVCDMVYTWTRMCVRENSDAVQPIPCYM